jgi:NodT family efflux transporter outer membrane factor (OMF) lipoprotein
MNRALLLLLLLTGCAVGPDYRAPQAETPARWRYSEETGAPPLEWWKTFQDAELDSLIERAVKTNLDLRVATARLREARALRSGAAWELLPTINSSAAYTDAQRAQNAQVFPIKQLHTDLYDARFDARWEIDVFGGRRRAVQSASARFREVEEQHRLVLVSVLAEVARNYVEIRGYQQRLEISRNNIVAQSNAVEIARARRNAGLTGELEVQRSEGLLATLRAQVPPSVTAADLALHRLGVLLGQLPEALRPELEVAAPIPRPPPAVPVGLPSELLRRRPDVRGAEHELQAATAEIGVEVAELFPKFSLIGTGGFQSLSVGDWFVPAGKYWSAGPTVTWRLLDFGRIRARIKAADARQEQALALYEKAVLGAFEDVENALVAYANEQVRYRALAEAVATSRRALALANEKYAKGLSDFLPVLDAERALYAAEDQLVVSERTVMQNLVAIYKALGGGWGTKNELAQEK